MAQESVGILQILPLKELYFWLWVPELLALASL